MALFSIGDRVVGNRDCYVIAEVGVNHGGSLDLAKQLVDLARQGGADAVKFQTYKADTLASKQSPAYWSASDEPTTSQYELFRKYDAFDADAYIELAECCAHIGIDFLSTPFDRAAVELLAPLVKLFKIASADITNVPLLRQVAASGRPVLLSVGASTHDEIGYALRVLQEGGCDRVALMHCVLNYPTSYENANLSMIEDLARVYSRSVIGYSDHTRPDPSMTVLTTAYLKGARILEKHFTHDKSLKGNDHYHAMDVNDLRHFRRQLAFIQDLEGGSRKEPLESEYLSRRNARRSIVLARDVEAGSTLSDEDLIPKRPALGISALNWDGVVGQSVPERLEADHVLQWGDLGGHRGKSIKPRVVAVVQARMGSYRFPGKMMAPLAGRPVVEWVLSRVAGAVSCDDLMLAIPDTPADGVLETAARLLGARTVRGDEQDVLRRFVDAARQSQADWVVRVCGDNPFTDPAEIDRLVRFALDGEMDYAFNHRNRLSNNYPDGFGAEIVSRAVLEDMQQVTTQIEHREHVTSYLWDNPFAHRVRTFAAPREIAFPDLRFDIDEPEDLLRLEPLAVRVGLGGTALDFVKAELEARCQSEREVGCQST